MNQINVKSKLGFTGIIACLVIGAITMSFQDTPFVNQIIDNRHAKSDTTPAEKGMTMKEFNQLSETLDKSMTTVEASLDAIHLNDISASIDGAMKELDLEKLLASVETSLASIDIDEIMLSVETSLSKEQWKEHEKEIQAALAEAREELKEARLEISTIDKEEIKKDLAEARKEIEVSKMEIKNVDMNKIKTEARKGITDAKKELANTKEMFVQMDKDGLIRMDKGFTIEFKADELFIDGKKQSPAVAEKYKKYTKGNDFKIKIEKD